MWCELDSKAAFEKALQDLPADKLLVVDYYAPGCAVCKTAYSSLCRIADTQEYKQGYVFCKVKTGAYLTSVNCAFSSASSAACVIHIAVLTMQR